MSETGKRTERQSAEERRRREALRSLLDRLSGCRDDLEREALTPAATMTEIVILTLVQAIEKEGRPPPPPPRSAGPLH